MLVRDVLEQKRFSNKFVFETMEGGTVRVRNGLGISALENEICVRQEGVEW